MRRIAHGLRHPDFLPKCIRPIYRPWLLGSRNLIAVPDGPQGRSGTHVSATEAWKYEDRWVPALRFAPAGTARGAKSSTFFQTLLARDDVVADARDELIHRHRSKVLAAAQPHRDLAAVALALADHQHVG